MRLARLCSNGTGKTAAFAIPLLQRIHVAKRRPIPFEPIGLILAPTRELVVQISENMQAIGRNTRVKHACIYGGVGQRPQVAALTQGVHVLVATPGRLLDLIDQQYCKLSSVECFVLDEADRMLDMDSCLRFSVSFGFFLAKSNRYFFRPRCRPQSSRLRARCYTIMKQSWSRLPQRPRNVFSSE